MIDVTIEHDEMLSNLYAKVCFVSNMTDFQKSKLKDEWDNFVKQVNKQIEQIESVRVE